MNLPKKLDSFDRKEVAKLSPLDKFRDEINRLKLKEAVKKRGQTIHFRDLDPSLLQEEDREIYEICKNSKIDIEERAKEFNEFRDRLSLLGESSNKNDPKSEKIIEAQKHFCGYLGNMLSYESGKKYLEQELKSFRQEIAEMIERNPSLQKIDPKFLGKKEMVAYRKYQEDNLSVDELKNYLKEVEAEIKKSKYNLNSPNSDFRSRLEFWNSLINGMVEKVYNGEYKKIKEDKNSGKRILE